MKGRILEDGEILVNTRFVSFAKYGHITLEFLNHINGNPAIKNKINGKTWVITWNDLLKIAINDGLLGEKND